MADEELEKIVCKVDYDKNGEINYSEFLTGTINMDEITEETLHNFFKYLDPFNREYICRESLERVFKRSGKDITLEEIETMMVELELNPEE